MVNPDYATGLASSLRAAIAARCPPTCGGALILLGDMPRVEAALIDALIAAFEARPNARRSRRFTADGAEILCSLSRTLFDRAGLLEGDEGARRLLASLPRRRHRRDRCGGLRVAFDVDTPSDLPGD